MSEFMPVPSEREWTPEEMEEFYERLESEPIRLVADPTCVNMLRSALLSAVAIGLFIWIVMEFCWHI